MGLEILILKKGYTFTWGYSKGTIELEATAAIWAFFVPCLQEPADKEWSHHFGRGDQPNHPEGEGCGYKMGHGGIHVEPRSPIWVSSGTSFPTCDYK